MWISKLHGSQSFIDLRAGLLKKKISSRVLEPKVKLKLESEPKLDGVEFFLLQENDGDLRAINYHMESQQMSSTILGIPGFSYIHSSIKGSRLTSRIEIRDHP